MRNIGTWLHDFDNLMPEQQLEVAEELVKQLDKKEWTAFTKDERERSKKTRTFLTRLIKATKNEQAISSGTVLERFDRLTPKNQEAVFGMIIGAIDETLKKQKHEYDEALCRREGHIFGDWKERRWTTNEVVWDAGPQGTITVNHCEWSRICKRCGHEETSKIEPLEVLTARKEKDRKDEIKQLRKRLKELGAE